MLYLTIGIDTESDNQWVTDARLRPTYKISTHCPVWTIFSGSVESGPRTW